MLQKQLLSIHKRDEINGLYSDYDATDLDKSHYLEAKQVKKIYIYPSISTIWRFPQHMHMILVFWVLSCHRITTKRKNEDIQIYCISSFLCIICVIVCKKFYCITEVDTSTARPQFVVPLLFFPQPMFPLFHARLLSSVLLLIVSL